MTTPLTLPELDDPDLSWSTNVDDDGDIVVRLLKRFGGGRVTIASQFASMAPLAEEAAQKIWDNYRTVRATEERS